MNNETNINYCLPETYCKDDEKWIAEMLSKLPQRVRKRVSALYADVFITEYDKEPIAHKKENKARREAVNTPNLVHNSRRKSCCLF
ncbi:hypothetical protein A9G38_10710 [Gilliamella sp. Imp1-1]|nr:hypothetical protein A9G38_10710 [Gilliamella apicola]